MTVLISLLSVFSEEEVHVHPVAYNHWVLLLLPGLLVAVRGSLAGLLGFGCLVGQLTLLACYCNPLSPLALPVGDIAKHVIHESLPHGLSALGLFRLLSALFRPIATPDLAVILWVLKEDRTSSCVEDKTLFRY